MANVIFDTNIYIFHSFRYKDAVEVWDKCVSENNAILISTIQITELLSFHLIDQQPSLKTQREKYISLADEVILVDDIIARKAAELRRTWKMYSGKALKLPDAVIAATASSSQTGSKRRRGFISYGYSTQRYIKNRKK